MADIAILVAEEYERRVRNLKKVARGGGGGDGAGEDRKIDMVSCVSAVAERMRDKIGAEKKESLNWVWDPKTQIGIAASNSFFSA
ncbi:hypothetical protein L6164_012347 [Bauhinia variegata]|uniref:Uncharacterized protein n=1 Tax=Bauhinia variegata TaxID=167791 RepID=A0ACB9PBA5_BAUVA|nr:hypothetical protein L6164_012347 [Bauhinia variegata]